MPVVIILAAGSINKKLNFLRSRCPSPALIPVNTRPLAAYLVDFYKSFEDFRVHLVLNAEVVDTVRMELGMMNGHCALFGLTTTFGVVDSLAQVAAELPDEADLIVNLVTTIPTRLVAPNEVFIANQPMQSGHWSGIILDEDRPVFSFKSSPLSVPCHAFTGVFRCESAALKAALCATEIKDDLLAVVEQLKVHHPLRYTPCEWIDCGHEINYYKAKAKLISSRSFNRIEVSLEDGVLSKHSQHEDKLAREVDYMEMLPADIRVYFPRVLMRRDASVGAPECVKMEYYGYPTVAEYLLYWELSSDNWQRLFLQLKGVLQRFKAYPYSISRAAFENFYLKKVDQRLDQFFTLLDSEMRQSLDREIVVNGRVCRPFAAMLDDLQVRLSSMYREHDFCVMHGDFCFNNILYDIPSGIVRLIDPRGSFGDRCVGIYGDQKYDLAKLKHSAEHGYDFLVNGLYTLSCKDRHFDYVIAARECSTLVAELEREVISELGYKNDEIELLTSLLFLSMCPLHTEDRARQLTMYAHGLRLLNNCLEN